MNNLDSIIISYLNRSAEIKNAMAADRALVEKIRAAGEALVRAVRAGGTIYSCGNGGSACDAMHFTEELVARYRRERPGIKAVHFLDPGTLTCWSNDYSYEQVFERQAATFCTDRDVLVVFSTSGNSPNVLRALAAAKKNGTYCIGLTGRDGGKLKELCDVTLIVPAQETDRIQEAHESLLHTLCELIEQQLIA